MPLKHREDGEELQHGGGALSTDARDTQGIVSVEIVFRRSIGGHVARRRCFQFRQRLLDEFLREYTCLETKVGIVVDWQKRVANNIASSTWRYLNYSTFVL